MQQKEKGNKNNNVQIGNAGSDNTFQISQTQNNSEPVQLEVDQANVRSFAKDEVHKKAIQSLSVSFLIFLTSIVSIASDCFGLAEKIGVSAIWLLVIAVPSIFATLWKSRQEIHLYLKRPKNPKHVSYAGDGELIEDDCKGNYLTYTRIGKCDYPNCSGHIILTDVALRERERTGKPWVGVCSVAGRDHSYKIDYIWNAYRATFDWRPLEGKT